MESSFTPGSVKLSSREFQHLSAIVHELSGIHLAEGKNVMLESRLHKRLRFLGMSTFKEYIQYISTRDGINQELVHMIDVVTTNKTDFFREPHHFDFLKDTILPDLFRSGKNRVNIWSSACSSGEEPYTLAMILEDFARLHRTFDYSIFASDISTKVLEKAAMAVYSVEHTSPIPAETKRKYLLKSKDKSKPTIRIVPELRRKINFARINLMDDVLDVDVLFDVIFCRNVLIYFDRSTQQEVVRKLANKLTKGGYLFIGHSESLFQLDLPIIQVKPTIYIKK